MLQAIKKVLSGGPSSEADDGIQITTPTPQDGADVHDLIEACPPLDTNSLYANLLQCSHFANTCAIARDENGKAVGWVSGYIPPTMPDTYFLWQVAVAESARGKNLPRRLVAEIFSRPHLNSVSYLNTTITPENDASWGLFRSLARHLDANLNELSGFDRDKHFNGRHETEVLVRIGPFEPSFLPSSDS